MAQLIPIAGWSGALRGHVILVHGLGGHGYDTWRQGPDNDTFWPLWLAQDLPGLAVHTLAYPAPMSCWRGTAMHWQDRAGSCLARLLAEPALKTGPIAFVCHSLGGVIIKRLLLTIDAKARYDANAADFLRRVHKVTFAATPHSGSPLATWARHIPLFRPSDNTLALRANDSTLHQLDRAYQEFADHQRATLRHQLFYETHQTIIGTIVEKSSATPWLPDTDPIPIDADHGEIVKPGSRDDLFYCVVKDFIDGLPILSGSAGDFIPAALHPTHSAPGKDFIAKLFSLARKAVTRTTAAPKPPLTAEQIRAIVQEEVAQAYKAGTSPSASAVDSLTTAVTDINAEAAQDTRYAQALALIASGKPGEGQSLLKLVAEEREKQAATYAKAATSNNRAAAAAYRNLAAIAALSDTAQARTAYAKAAQLDPSDLESVYNHGWYQRQAGNLTAADTAYAQVIASAQLGDENWPFWALAGRGDLQIQRGNLTAAMGFYQQAKNLVAPLTRADPQNRLWQRDLSASFDKIGDILSAQSNLDGALKAYRDGLDIRQTLAKADPGNAQAQRDLSVSFDNIGDVLRTQGNLDGALKAFRDSLDIAQTLAKADPGNAQAQRDLSVSFDNIGDVLSTQGNLDGALKAFRDSLDIRQTLAKAAPSNAQAQRDLAVSHISLATLAQQMKNPPQVLADLRTARDIVARLLQSSPGNQVLANDLAWVEARQAEWGK